MFLPRKPIRPPKVSDKQLLTAFERLCHSCGVVSRGFEPGKITAPIDGDKYDGTTQWAIRKDEGGWMIVCGWKGCGIKFVRWNGRVRTRWDFLMLLEALWCMKVFEEDPRNTTELEQKDTLLDGRSL